MRRAVRRFTWILLSLGVITVLCFGLLAKLLPERGAARTVPLFFNLAPRNVRDLSLDALDRLVKNQSPSEPASAELARLGGAALPHVMPHFDRLDTDARERVALALAPVALRMGAARPDELATGPAAVAFWARYWQDRGVDFREPVVRRLVARLAERSLVLRREDVLIVDTYALPELMRSLGSVKTDDDVRRVRRLTTVLAHVADKPWVVERGSTVPQAAEQVRKWQAFWEEQGSDYTPLDGPHRLAAMVKDTGYGRWLASVLRGELGRLGDGRTGIELVRGAAPKSLALLGLVLALGTLLGAVFARSAARKANGWPLAVALLLCSLPSAALLSLLGPGDPTTRLVLSGSILVVAQAALIIASLGHGSAEDQGFAARLRAALLLVAPQAPVVASTVLALECAFGLAGLGPELRAALARSDLHASMAVSLCCATAALTSMLLADALGALLAPAEERAS